MKSLLSTATRVAAAFAVSAALASCGNSAPPALPQASAPSQSSAVATSSEPPTFPAASPSPTETVTGLVESSDESFTVQVPSGWEQVEIPAAVLTVRSNTPVNGYSSNLVVNQHKNQAAHAHELLNVETFTLRYEKDLPAQEIGGVSASGASFLLHSQNPPVEVAMYSLPHGDHAYTVVLSYRPEQRQEAQKIFNKMLKTWKWKT